MILAQKLIEIPEFLWYVPEKLTKFRNFTWFCPKNARFLHKNCQKNIFPDFFGGPLPLPSPTPYLHVAAVRSSSVAISESLLFPRFVRLLLDFTASASRRVSVVSRRPPTQSPISSGASSEFGIPPVSVSHIVSSGQTSASQRKSRSANRTNDASSLQDSLLPPAHGPGSFFGDLRKWLQNPTPCSQNNLFVLCCSVY